MKIQDRNEPAEEGYDHRAKKCKQGCGWVKVPGWGRCKAKDGN